MRSEVGEGLAVGLGLGCDIEQVWGSERVRVRIRSEVCNGLTVGLGVG